MVLQSHPWHKMPMVTRIDYQPLVTRIGYCRAIDIAGSSFAYSAALFPGSVFKRTVYAQLSALIDPESVEDHRRVERDRASPAMGFCQADLIMVNPCHSYFQVHETSRLSNSTKAQVSIAL